MTVESLKTIFDWSAVILLFLTFAAAAGVLITGNIVTERQAARLLSFDKSLTEAKTELGKQQERAAKAEKSASDAALDLAKFKQPRSLLPEQQSKLILDVKPFAGQNFAFAVFPDPEPQALTRVIDGLLKSAGWKRVPSQIQREGVGILMDIAGESAAQISDLGVDVYIAPDDTESVRAQGAICAALAATGIPCETHRTPQLAGKTPRAITISIGKKP